MFTSATRRGIFAVMLSFCLFLSYGCSLPDLSKQSLSDFDLPILGDLGNDLKEVSPPALIQSLKTKLEASAPRVSILLPQNGELLDDESVEVKLSLSDFKIFKDRELGLGPHIILVLDDQAPIEVFDLEQPIHFDDLRPGTHTLRAIAEYPWHESFKNAEAYAQVSFNVLTASQANAAGQSPILTTSSVGKIYTEEPMLLDFVVRAAQPSVKLKSSPQVKVSLNDESFVIDSADGSVYLSGLKTGQNWLKLELQDAKGHLSSAPFSEQLFGFEFHPEQTSPMGNLFAEKVSLDAVGSIVGIAKPNPPEIIKPPIPAQSTPASSTPARSAPAPSKDPASSQPVKPGTPTAGKKDSKPSTPLSLETRQISKPALPQQQQGQATTKPTTTRSEPSPTKEASSAPKTSGAFKAQNSAQTPSSHQPPADKPETEFGAQMRSLKAESQKQMAQTLSHWRDRFSQDPDQTNQDVRAEAISPKASLPLKNSAASNPPDHISNPSKTSTLKNSDVKNIQKYEQTSQKSDALKPRDLSETT